MWKPDHWIRFAVPKQMLPSPYINSTNQKNIDNLGNLQVVLLAPVTENRGAPMQFIVPLAIKLNPSPGCFKIRNIFFDS